MINQLLIIKVLSGDTCLVNTQGCCNIRGMPEEVNNFCRCDLARTTAYVVTHSNVCPECGLKFVDDGIMGNIYENVYQGSVEAPNDEAETTKNSAWKKGLKYVLENLESPLEKGYKWNTGYKLPTFSGDDSEEVTHYFVKFRVYLIENEISAENDIIRKLTLSLSGKALELYLTLPKEILSNLKDLERLFKQHFSPPEHEFLELRNFLRIQKSTDESISQYFLRLTKIACERGISDDVVRAVIINGLPMQYLKHVAMQKANTLSEIKVASAEFEKLEQIENCENFLRPKWGDGINQFRQMMNNKFKEMGDALEANLLANGEAPTGATVATLNMGEDKTDVEPDSAETSVETDGGIVCYFCGSIGHVRRFCKCLKQLKILQKNIEKQNRCLQIGRVKNRRHNCKRNRIQTCFYCCKPGHIRRHCPERTFSQKNKNEQFTRPSNIKRLELVSFAIELDISKLDVMSLKSRNVWRKGMEVRKTLQCCKMAKKGRRNYIKLRAF